MNSAKKISATRQYAIALILAVMVLLVTAAISYSRIKGLQDSAELVNRSMAVQKEINHMFSNYSMLQSTELNYAADGKEATLFLLENYRKQSEESLQRLRRLTADNAEQQRNLDRLTGLKTDFLKGLETLIKGQRDSTETRAEQSLKRADLSGLMEKIKSLKDEMIASEEIALKERKKEYNVMVWITPLTMLCLVLFSTAIFALAFWKIIKHRHELVRTKSFLENILQSITNIIIHLEPIRDGNGTITDYTFIYSNEPLTKATGAVLEEIKGKRISEVFPHVFNNGVFELMNEAVESDKVLEIEREYEMLGKRKVFRSTAIKLDRGVVITSWETTLEKLAAEQMQRFNEQLALTNASLNKAESMARTGSYRLDTTTGVAEISDNFYRLLGLEPKEVQMTYDAFKAFVHADDLAEFERLTLLTMKNKGKREQTYRIVTNNGTVKTITSIGHFIKEGQKDVLIGVVQDITDEIRRKHELEDQNLDLKRSIEELDSFNHVVSHDLQEPLRKIQTFISLINEKADLSEEDRTYFQRIDAAALRMRTLIKHLLTYSRIGKAKNKFELVDLNDALIGVREDQSNLMTEKQAKLAVKKMPVVYGIRFQLVQLFNNLVSNALKYSKVEGASKILIASEMVHRNQIIEDFRKKSKKYHKITVSDNGLGFDQEYSDKIFELFQRLHQNGKYAGTGLGLAICKKIVENHQGHISAVGEKAVGATFTIYLPAAM